MTEPLATVGILAGKRILVVEDQYLIAADLRRALEDEAAIVIGPAGTVPAGMALTDQALDGAILDVNLRNATSLPIAERLEERAIPYLFLTGQDGWALPDRFRDVPRVLKPYRMSTVLSCLQHLTHRSEP